MTLPTVRDRSVVPCLLSQILHCELIRHEDFLNLGEPELDLINFKAGRPANTDAHASVRRGGRGRLATKTL